jgi:4-hydroxy-3-polyprenylbenzoate decarboxylase
MKVLVSIGGASGSIYGYRLVEYLKKHDNEVHLIVSECGKKILKHETSYSYNDIRKKVDFCYDNSDLFAGPASGSFQLDAMVVCPCSIKTLSAIANGYGNTLTSRSASCFLKEEKKLIIVLRETPLNLPVIKNMLSAKESGATILPAMPGFYHKPKNIDDIVDFIIGKISDQLKMDHLFFKRWG